MPPKPGSGGAVANLLVSAHHLSCMAATSALAAAVLRRDQVQACSCRLQQQLDADKSVGRIGHLRHLLKDCQRLSAACLEAHSSVDIPRLRKLNKEFVATVGRVHHEVRRIYSVQPTQDR